MTHIEVDMSCSNCFYYYANVEVKESYCRRYPPKMSCLPYEGFGNPDTFWPDVVPSAWCGEWQPKFQLEGNTADIWHHEQHRPKCSLAAPDELEAYVPGLGTVRACLDCDCLVAGGPTRCKRCASDANPK